MKLRFKLPNWYVNRNIREKSPSRDSFGQDNLDKSWFYNISNLYIGIPAIFGFLIFLSVGYLMSSEVVSSIQIGLNSTALDPASKTFLNIVPAFFILGLGLIVLLIGYHWFNRETIF